MGLWKGKKGTSVFYKVTNSNNAQKQGIRERVYDPANPRSTNQASQRMKLLPAQRVYGTLKPILERAWQGVKYGPQARYKFLSYALKMTDGFPYVEKDDSNVVPGSYMISRGTLPQITMAIDDMDGMISNITLGIDAPTTIGEVSTAILENNVGFRDGDQITAVYCQGTDSMAWGYESFYIDPTSADNFPLNAIDVLTIEGTYYLAITADQKQHAGAFIHSRLNGDTYERSTAVLLVNTANPPVSNYYTPAQEIRARKSYQNRETIAQNWEVEQDAELIEGAYDSTWVLAGLTGELAPFNGKACKIRKSIETDLPVQVYTGTFQGDGGYLVDENERVLTASDGGTPPSEYGILQSSVQFLAALPSYPV